MTTTVYLVWLVATGAATMAILIVGALAAADSIHFGPRAVPAPVREDAER